MISVSKSFTKVFEATIDPASVTNATSAAQTFTVTGLTTNMIVGGFFMPSLEAGLVVSNVGVSATNTLSIKFANVTGAPIDPASQVIKVVIL